MLRCSTFDVGDAVVDDARGKQHAPPREVRIQLIKETDDDIRNDVCRD